MIFFRTASFLVIVLLLLIYHSLVGVDPRGAHDFPYSYPEAIKESFNLPLIWSERFDNSFGVYSTSTLWSYPLDLLYGFGANLGIDFSILMRLLGVIPTLVIGFISLKKISDSYNLDQKAGLIGSLLFLANTYILLLIDGGQINLALAYSLLPGVFYLYKKYFFSNLWERMYFILSLILLATFDIRILFFLFILILFDFMFILVAEYQQLKKNLWNGVVTSLLTIIFFFGVNSYWILPSLFVKPPVLPEGYSSQGQVDFLSFANLGHSFSLLSPHWYQNIFGQISPLIPYLFLIPLLVFSCLALRSRDKKVAFWVIIALLGVFLSKGGNPPFPPVYKWLFSNFPGFFMFRDPVKFYFLIALSYSILTALALDSLLTRFKRIGNFIFISVALLLTSFIYPVYTNKMTGLFSSGEKTGAYFNLADFLKHDSNFGRVLWIPSKPTFGFTNPNHPSVEATALINKRPFTSGVIGSYEVLNYLREASFIGELLNVAGIKYVIYPQPDFEQRQYSKDEINYYYTFLNQISQQYWVEQKISEIQVPTFLTKKHQNKFFLANNLWFVIGADSIYEEATKSSSLTLENNALVFIDESQGDINWLEKYPNANLTLYKKTQIDLGASFIRPDKVYSISKSLDYSPDQTGWWKREGKDLISLRQFLKDKYSVDIRDFDLNQGWAIAEGSLEKVVEPRGKMGDVLLARVYESSSSGIINFLQDNQEIGKINTKIKNYQESNVRWREVGKLLSDKPLEIKTSGSINILNAIAILPEEDWLNLKRKAQKLQDQGQVKDYDDNNVLPPSGTVKFETVNSTKYKAVVQGLRSPAVIVLGQSFDDLWTNGNNRALPVYSLLNGFPIQSDGEYIIEYEPQKYVYKGLVISILNLSVLAVLIIFFRFRTMYN